MKHVVRCVQGYLDEAVNLALRRYALEHPAKRKATHAFIGVVAMRRLSKAQVITRALQLGKLIDSLERRLKARGGPDWEATRTRLFYGRATAASARTGIFASSMGPLTWYLRELGEPTDEIRIDH